MMMTIVKSKSQKALGVRHYDYYQYTDEDTEKDLETYLRQYY